MAGGSLADRLHDWHWRPTLKHIIEFAIRIAEGLSYLESIGIVHRDIKPGNLLFDENDRIYIADFGLAQVLEKAYPRGSVIGTPAYMAPEIWRNPDQITSKADIYSFGVVLFQLVSGLMPYTDTGDQYYAWQHIYERPKNLNRLTTIRLPKKFTSLVMRCLEKDPRKRVQASQLVEELQNLLLLPDSDLNVCYREFTSTPESRSPIPRASVHRTQRLAVPNLKNQIDNGSKRLFRASEFQNRIRGILSRLSAKNIPNLSNQSSDTHYSANPSTGADNYGNITVMDREGLSVSTSEKTKIFQDPYAWLKVLSGPQVNAKCPIFNAEGLSLQVGRDVDDRNFRLNSQYVSRKHAMFESIDGSLFIRDLNSASGTKLNGLRLNPNQLYEVSVGDELYFGDIFVRLEKP